MLVRTLALALALAVLGACGGGGGGGGGGSGAPAGAPASPPPASDPSSNPPPPQTPAPDPSAGTNTPPTTTPDPTPDPGGGGGGGGGGGATNPPPKPPDPQPATINTATVNAFVSQTVAALRIGIASQGVTNYVRQIVPTGSALTQSGCASGSVTYTINPAGPADATYTNYDNCAGWIVNGSASGTGRYVASNTSISSQAQDFVRLDLEFSNLQYTRKADSASFRLAGSMRIVKIPAHSVLVSTSFPGYVATIDASLFDASDAPVFSMQDFIVHSDPKSPGIAAEAITFSGRIVDPVLGFVDTISPARMIFSLSSAALSTGSFTMLGASTQAAVTYTNGVAETSIESRPVSNNPLDASFGADGKVTTDFNNGVDIGWVVARQPDGKLVAAGTSRTITTGFVLARYNEDGRLDTAFGSGGKVTTAVFRENLLLCRCMVLQPDGKIVVAGTTHRRPRTRT